MIVVLLLRNIIISFSVVCLRLLFGWFEFARDSYLSSLGYPYTCHPPALTPQVLDSGHAPPAGFFVFWGFETGSSRDLCLLSVGCSHAWVYFVFVVSNNLTVLQADLEILGSRDRLAQPPG